MTQQQVGRVGPVVGCHRGLGAMSSRLHTPAGGGGTQPAAGSRQPQPGSAPVVATVLLGTRVDNKGQELAPLHPLVCVLALHCCKQHEPPLSGAPAHLWELTCLSALGVGRRLVLTVGGPGSGCQDEVVPVPHVWVVGSRWGRRLDNRLTPCSCACTQKRPGRVCACVYGGGAGQRVQKVRGRVTHVSTLDRSSTPLLHMMLCSCSATSQSSTSQLHDVVVDGLQPHTYHNSTAAPQKAAGPKDRGSERNLENRACTQHCIRQERSCPAEPHRQA
jgi:hypothetical protein